MTRREFRISDQCKSAKDLATADEGSYSAYPIPEHISDEDSAVHGCGLAFTNDWCADGTVSGVFRIYTNAVGEEVVKEI